MFQTLNQNTKLFDNLCNCVGCYIKPPLIRFDPNELTLWFYSSLAAIVTKENISVSQFYRGEREVCSCQISSSDINAHTQLHSFAGCLATAEHPSCMHLEQTVWCVCCDAHSAKHTYTAPSAQSGSNAEDHNTSREGTDMWYRGMRGGVLNCLGSIVDKSPPQISTYL